MTATTVTPDASADLSKTYSLVIPVLLAIVPFATLPIGADYSFYRSWMITEAGAIEHATVLFSVIGFVIALLVVVNRQHCPRSWMMALMLFFAVGFFYIAGEEASWGQHLFLWDTPGWMAEANRQNETNLHNLHLSLDRIPKTIIGIGIVLSGLAWPIYSRVRKVEITNTEGDWYWLWPTAVVRVTALLFLIIWLLDRLMVQTNLLSGEGYSIGFQEHREVMMVYFLLLYVASIYVRVKARKSASL
ncbi:hypothetical protein [Pelagibius sp. Alg239-R121]|uniref:hypothetical protein n=1 Tax=Pelagibius sp. Alg239-R121 TaxID=2993448 RepID=UPI0024A6D2CA|nr:hypothetical protein [Pelagibius sp. Alg239-R121]